MSTSFWTMTDANTGVPLFAPTALKLAPTRANANVIYANSNTAQAFSAAVGVYGVDTEEASNVLVTPAATRMAHAGWVQRTAGMGAVLTITANTGAYSPDGNIFVTFTEGGTGSTEANASVLTDGSKQIVSITVNEGGLYLTTPSAAIVNSNAALTLTMGGRANRTQYETLVATGTITGNGAVII
jgi:hypothetical protein